MMVSRYILFLLVNTLFVVATSAQTTSNWDLSDSVVKTQEQDLNLLLMDSIKTQQKIINKLNLRVEKLQIPQDNSLSQNQTDSIIALNRTIRLLKSDFQELEASNEVQYSSVEKEVIAVVKDLHTSLLSLSGEGKPKDVLAFFLPRFSINQVLIDSENKGHILGCTHEDYSKFLKDLDQDKGYSFKILEDRFYDVAVKGDHYLNVIYGMRILVYHEGILKTQNKQWITITGRKEAGEWKIASYSRVEFEYKVQ